MFFAKTYGPKSSRTKNYFSGKLAPTFSVKPNMQTISMSHLWAKFSCDSPEFSGCLPLSSWQSAFFFSSPPAADWSLKWSYSGFELFGQGILVRTTNTRRLPFKDDAGLSTKFWGRLYRITVVRLDCGAWTFSCWLPDTDLTNNVYRHHFVWPSKLNLKTIFEGKERNCLWGQHLQSVHGVTQKKVDRNFCNCYFPFRFMASKKVFEVS